MPGFLSEFRWQDILDIAAVSVVLYWILLLIRGTRAIQMVFGLAVLGAVYLFTVGAEMSTLGWILKNFLTSIVIVVVILFQDEIRRALALVGSNPLTGQNPRERKHTIEEVVKAAAALANKRIGALIAMERTTGLKNYIERGSRLDALVNRDLILSIFLPFSPIHDGAVIISDGRIAAAQCFLPLTLNPRLEKVLGTRHRAALGLSEETDAVVVVVSEETGKISAACEGKLYSRLEPDELRHILVRIMAVEPRQAKAGILGILERIKLVFSPSKKPAA